MFLAAEHHLVYLCDEENGYEHHGKAGELQHRNGSLSTREDVQKRLKNASLKPFSRFTHPNSIKVIYRLFIRERELLCKPRESL